MKLDHITLAAAFAGNSAAGTRSKTAQNSATAKNSIIGEKDKGTGMDKMDGTIL